MKYIDNKNNTTNKVISIILLLLITIGVSFSYFSANISGEETGTTITVTGGTMNINYASGSSINIANVYPKEEALTTKTITVTGNNTTQLKMYYNISLTIESNGFSTGRLKYKLISTNTGGNGTVASSITMEDIPTGTNNIILGNGSFTGPTSGAKVHTYNLEIYFPNTEENQNYDHGKSIKAYIEIDEGNVLLSFNEDKGVNRPVLATGMTPVIYNTGNSSWEETTEDDPNWYDYDAKKWANAQTEDGSFWVWIPRYAYKITSGYHLSTTGTIDIKFLKGKTNQTIDATKIETRGYSPDVKDTSMHYFMHPAFKFGDDEITGIWVAKFESSNDGNGNIKVIPNAISWRSISISSMFFNTQAMKNQISIYGWNPEEIDTHLMKNIEWGAATYLSKTNYGADKEKIWNNAYNGNVTGCSGSIVNAINESTCLTYETPNGQKASTTYNIYGVYDMSGGALEFVMGNYDNVISGSGFDEISSIVSKYIDRYSGEGSYDKIIYGDAVYEISSLISGSTSWFGEYSCIPSASNPWFARGGGWGSGSVAGPFGFYYDSGNSVYGGGFRVVLMTTS